MIKAFGLFVLLAQRTLAYASFIDHSHDPPNRTRAVPHTGRGLSVVSRSRCDDVPSESPDKGVLNIPQGVTSLKFYYCRTLEEVHIPSSMKKIEDYAFQVSTLKVVSMEKVARGLKELRGSAQVRQRKRHTASRHAADDPRVLTPPR